MPDLSYLHEIPQSSTDAPPLSNGKGPYMYEEPDHRLGILVCGNPCGINLSAPWDLDSVSATDEVLISYCNVTDGHRTLEDRYLPGLSPEQALAVGERLAGIYVRSGMDAFLLETGRMPFLEREDGE